MLMDTSNAYVNKRLYKIFLSVLKYTPIILFLIFIIGFILNFFGIPAILLNFIGGTSIMFLILLYILSYVFKFCYLFRIPLHYITIVNLISTIDTIFAIPLSTIILLELNFILAGIALVLYIYFAYKNRNSKKVDPIVELCKRYCGLDCQCSQEV